MSSIDKYVEGEARKCNPAVHVYKSNGYIIGTINGTRVFSIADRYGYLSTDEANIIHSSIQRYENLDAMERKRREEERKRREEEERKRREEERKRELERLENQRINTRINLENEIKFAINKLNASYTNIKETISRSKSKTNFSQTLKGMKYFNVTSFSARADEICHNFDACSAKIDEEYNFKLNSLQNIKVNSGDTTQKYISQIASVKRIDTKFSDKKLPLKEIENFKNELSELQKALYVISEVEKKLENMKSDSLTKGIAENTLREIHEIEINSVEDVNRLLGKLKECEDRIQNINKDRRIKECDLMISELGGSLKACTELREYKVENTYEVKSWRNEINELADRVSEAYKGLKAANYTTCKQEKINEVFAFIDDIKMNSASDEGTVNLLKELLDNYSIYKRDDMLQADNYKDYLSKRQELIEYGVSADSIEAFDPNGYDEQKKKLNKRLLNIEDIEKNITFDRVTEEYVLPSYKFTGYINTGWKDKAGKTVTNEEIRGVTGNGIHLYSEWTPIQYTVKYVVRDETGNTEATENWNYETESKLKNLSEISDKTITGYKFIGWTTDKSVELDEIEFDFDTLYSKLTTVNDGEVILYDVWTPITYILRFESDEQYEADHIDDVTLKYNEDYTLPTCESKGYNFKNWVLKSDNTVYLAERSIQGLSAIENDVVTFVSDWTEKEYTLRFKYDEKYESTQLEDVQLKYTEKYVLPAGEAIGYKFDSWKIEGDEKTYSADEEISKLTDKDGSVVVLNAQLIANTYTLTFEKNIPTHGSSSQTTKQQVCTYDNEEELAANTYKVNGWLFKGWATAPNGNVVYNDNDFIKNLTAVDKAEIKFYAVWAVNPYKVGKYVGSGVKVSDTTGENPYVVYNSLTDLPSTITDNENTVIVDLSSYSSKSINKTLNLNLNKALFVGKSGAVYTSLNITSQSKSELNLELSNFKFSASEGTPLNMSAVKSVIFTYEGECSITASNANTAVLGQNLTINSESKTNVLTIKGGDGYNSLDGGIGISVTDLTILGSGKINVYGGNGYKGLSGSAGSAGANSSKTSGSGSAGKDGNIGVSGGNGGTAVSAANVVIDAPSSVIVFNGGTGGQGGSGGAGGKGGNGSGGGPLFSYDGGNGGNGGKGGAGGSGGSGGKALSVTTSFLPKTGNITLYGGNGGKGGDGGTGGNGGNGGSKWLFGSNGKKGYGGSGGTGGTGGNGGISCNIEVSTSGTAKITRANGAKGNSGSKGVDGTGR